MRIVVFSRRTPEPEPQCDRLAIGMARRGHEIVHVDIAAFVRGGVSFDPATGVVIVDDVAIDPAQIDVVLLGPLPGAVAWSAPPGTSLTADEHFARARAQGARHAMAWSVVLDLERRGVPVVSSPSRARPFDHKPFQLATLGRHLPVPRTIVTAEDAVARAFVEAVGEAVVKSITGGPARRYDDVQVRAADPVLVQERVRGQDVRAVVVGDEVVAAAVFEDGGNDADDVVDVRERESFVDGSGRYLPIDDAAVLALARRAAALCCCDFAAVDLKRRADGTFVVLEVNRTPVVLDIEDDLSAPITDRVIDLLESRARRA